MPPRAVTLAIVALWLAAVGWLGYREWWAEPEPPALLARADEVGTQYANWRMWRADVNAGPGQFVLQRDRGSYLFRMGGEFRPDEATFRGLTITALAGTYRVTARGLLRGLGCKVVLGGYQVQLRGRLDGGRFTAEVRHGDAAAPEQVEAEVPGGLLNLLQPLHRLDGLHEGQQWRTAVFDPLEAAHRSRQGRRGWPLRVLEATVAGATLEGWHEQSVPCWRVDYCASGRINARVWARADDGLVLRQEVHHDSDTWTRLERDPERGAPIPKLPKLIP